MTQSSDQRLDQIEQILDNLAANQVAERDSRLELGDDLEILFQTVQQSTETTDRAISSLTAQVNQEDESLASYLNRFVCSTTDETDETDENWNINIGQTLLIYRQYVCGQFWRVFIDKQFQKWRMPRYYPKDLKERVNLQALLMGQVWRTIKLLPQSVNPKPVVLYEILLEAGLLFPDCIAADPQEKITATKSIRRQQGINRKLQALRNPFDRGKTPETWAFVDNCQRLANQNHDFQKDYTQLIETRMKLVTAIRKSQPKVIDKSGKSKENRGRKSISRSRSRSG